jgi:uncharacterized membrane protein
MDFLALIFESIVDDAMASFSRIQNLFVRTTVQFLCLIVCCSFFIGFGFVSELLVFDVLQVESKVLAVFLFILFYVIFLSVFVLVIKLANSIIRNKSDI